jgi:2-aminoethylphosphonate-pyruvate transaminase
MDDDIPYLLLTPGPLTTSRTVREAMLHDYSTWDVDYNDRVQSVRRQIVRLATGSDDYSCVLIQGSGTFAVEATIGSAVPADGKILVVDNGAYGRRMAEIAGRIGVACTVVAHAETEPVDIDRVRAAIEADSGITHLAMVHCETTTGMLNPAVELGVLAAELGVCFILDAMSSFGGIPLAMEEAGVHYLISSANKCIQGVPGFGFVVARRSNFELCEGRARSLSLDLHDQWRQMETGGGKWRYTSPTHTLLAFEQALAELAAEGGVAARHARYTENHRVMVAGMRGLGFRTLLPDVHQAPIITSFLFPGNDVVGADRFEFGRFYEALKARRFVIYPGKVTHAETFRIGNIGHVFPGDMVHLTESVGDVMKEIA